MTRIALPNKGRLADDARELFADAGLEIRARGDRALSASLGGSFDAIFVRAEDIPEFVADGAAELGVTGWDLARESGRRVESVLDLEFGRCRLALAASEDTGFRSVSDVPRGARVATTFPKLASAFFERAGTPVEIVPVSGAVEVAPHLGLADVIVDLVSTGSTMRVNGLREIGLVMESTARLIARPRSASEAIPAVDDLVSALASVIHARSRRYLMANVPRGRLDDVKRVLPGVGGPTVIDILNGGDHVAVHAVVCAREIDRRISDLRGLGASGILVTRIERFVQ